MNLIGIETPDGAVSCKGAGSYNWTLLELKHVLRYAKSTWEQVIIEPYWNWNSSTISAKLHENPVIIEPYWNWNDKATVDADKVR